VLTLLSTAAELPYDVELFRNTSNNPSKWTKTKKPPVVLEICPALLNAGLSFFQLTNVDIGVTFIVKN